MSAHPPLPPPQPQCPSPAPPPPPSPSPSGSSSSSGLAASRWFFPGDLLDRSPSIRSGLPKEKELSYRQQAANFIQDMGQRLQVTQLCINTAIVYMQRFYMFHSFTRFHRNTMASAALFLAAKVEEQPRKLEHVIKVAHICLHRDQPQLDTRSEAYQEQASELVANENILLQTLGFDVAIDHPHTHVVRCCQLVKASKELAQTSYFMATNSLHLTTMCLRYSPTTVACVCIHLACKWSNYKIPTSREGKPWYNYIDANANQDLLDKLTDEFLVIFDKCPSRLKRKIMASTEATKQEEERRARGDIMPSQYQPDLNVRRGEAQSSTAATPSISGSRSAAVTPTGTPAQNAVTPMSTPKVLAGRPSPGFGSRTDKTRPPPESLKRPHPQHPSVQDDPKRRRTDQPSSHSSHQRPSQQLYDASKIQHRLPHHQQQKVPGSHGPPSSGHHSRPNTGHHQRQQVAGHHGSSAAHSKPQQPQPHGTNASSKHSTLPSGSHHSGHHQRSHHGSSSHPKPGSHHSTPSGDHHSSSTHHHRSHPDGRRSEGGHHSSQHHSRQQQHQQHAQQKGHVKTEHPQHTRHSSSSSTSSQHGPHHHLASKHQQHPGSQHKQPAPARSMPSYNHQVGENKASTNQQPQQQPQRSIFDIDVNSTSPLNTGRSSSLGSMVFDPIESPASLAGGSEINDLFGASGAADMDLEDGEIIDSKSEVGAMLLSNTNPAQKPPIDNSAQAPKVKTEPQNGNNNSAPTIAKMLSSSNPAPPMPSLTDVKPFMDASSSASRKRPSPVTTKKLFGEEDDEPEATDAKPNLVAASIFGLAKQRTPSPKKKVKEEERKSGVSLSSIKPPSLFSPPSGGKSDDHQRNRTTSSSGDKSPAIKLSKLENMSGFEQMKDGRKSIKVNKEERPAKAPNAGAQKHPHPAPAAHAPTQQQTDHQVAQVKPMMPVSIPLTSVKQEGGAGTEDASKREHKEKKKKKKEKKEKKDKEKRRDKDGESSSSSKKSKKKSKDRDRERGDSSSRAGSLASSPAPSSSQQSTSSSGTVPKLKIKLGAPGGHASSSTFDNNQATEVLPSSTGKLKLSLKSTIPAAKMSRVMANSHDMESMYYTSKVDHHKKSKSHV